MLSFIKVVKEPIVEVVMDDRTKQGADRLRVAKGEDYEVNYLAQKFNVSKEEVIRAIDKAGPMRTNVEAELQKNRRD